MGDIEAALSPVLFRASAPAIIHLRIAFDNVNEDLLARLLQPLVHLAAGNASLGRVRAVLDLNEMGAREPRPASSFVIARLDELILIEILQPSRPKLTLRGPASSPVLAVRSQHPRSARYIATLPKTGPSPR